MQPNGQTKTMCVIGSPIGHTLSPQIHNQIIEGLGLNAVYTAFEVLPENLGAAMGAMRAMGILGMNVTIPHKQAVMAFLDEVDQTATLCGAVNTVANRNGRLCGTSTDGEGFLKSLARAGFFPEGKTVTLLGAGGAARAVCAALALSGAKKITVSNKTEARAAELCQAVNDAAGREAAVFGNPNYEADLFVNATPVGMTQGGAAPFEAPSFDFDAVGKKAFFYDLIYNPRQTQFLYEAEKRGHQAQNGLGMLIYQAVLAFSHFTGAAVPLHVTNALFESLSFSKNVVLTGFMGCGKSSLGRRLAEKMAVAFYDTDDLVEQEEGMTVSEIFAQKGEAYFRRAESGVIARLAKRRGAVISLGGGAVKNPENIALLKKNGVVFCLDRDVRHLLGRPQQTRPLIKDKTLAEIEALKAQRAPLYEGCGHKVLIKENDFDANIAFILDKLHEMQQVPSGN